MGVGQGFKMALKSIFSNKVRSVLTMLGIIIGVAAVMILVSVVRGSSIEQRKYFESLGTNKITVYAYMYNKDMTQDLYDFCLSLDDLILGVTPNGYYWGDTKYKATSTSSNQQYGRAQIYLGSDQYSLCQNYKVTLGRDLSYLDIRNYNQVAVIGSMLKEYLFQYRDPIGERITIGGHPFTVVGVYEQKGNDNDWWYNYMAVLPHTMNRLLNNNMSMSNEFTVKAKSASATNDAIAKLTEYLELEIGSDYQRGYFSVYSDNTWMEQSDEQNKIMSMVLGGIAGISLLVGGIGIMNIMLVTVRERTREIGIRKAIGGARRSILVQFLIEAAVICGMGGLIGILLGFLGSLVAGKLILNIVLFPDIYLSAGAFAFSVALGVGFGMYPAIKASGLQPVEALRTE